MTMAKELNYQQTTQKTYVSKRPRPHPNIPSKDLTLSPNMDYNIVKLSG